MNQQEINETVMWDIVYEMLTIVHEKLEHGGNRIPKEGADSAWLVQRAVKEALELVPMEE